MFWLLIFGTIIFNVSAFALPGDVDPTFKTGGFVISNFGGAAYSSTLQADGKLVIVGNSSSSNGGSDFTTVRYNSDGTLDAAFGTAGKVVTDLGSANDIPFAVAQQPDGKLLVGGQYQIGSNFDYQFALVRYNTNGSLDATFGNAGIVTTQIGEGEDIINQILLLPDGKIIAAGRSQRFSTAQEQTAVVRYLPNGTVDTTFATNGIALSPANLSTRYFGGAALQADGKLVVVASQSHQSTTNYSFNIVRYNADGTIDTSFGGGQVEFQFRDSSENYVNDVTIQADGKILVAGSVYAAVNFDTLNDYDFALARFNSDGTFDTSFDGDGKLTTSFGFNAKDSAQEIVFQPDGKFIVGGSSGTASGPSIAVARYNLDGSLDANFGDAGKVTASIFGGSAASIELQADGKILAVGTGFTPQTTRPIIVRFKTSGALDQSFNPGTPGRVIIPQGETNTATAISVQPDGKIIAAGTGSSTTYTDFTVSKTNADGTPDLTFGNTGNVVTSVSDSIDGASAVAVQTDGKIVAAGYAGIPGSIGVALVRYNRNGSLDTTFDMDGKLILPISGISEAAYDVVIQTDGKIVIAGFKENSSSTQNFFLARFNPNGSLDTTFGTNGTVTTVVGSGGDFAKSLVLQTDGKLIAVGTARTGTNGDFAAVRYNADGSLDSTFGTNGKAIISIDNGNDDANDAAIQSDGKIVLAGTTLKTNEANFALVRLNANGSLDTSFGDAGKSVATRFGYTAAEALTIQPGGKIIVAGSKFTGSQSDIAVVRYTSTGFPDPTFGSGGLVLTDIDNRRDVANDVALQGSDKIIVGGGTYTSTGNPATSNLVLIRYQANDRTGFDFDGDGKGDISVFRPTGGFWYLLNSSTGFTGFQFGDVNDKVVPADYDGDGKTDVAVFRGGTWYIQRSQLGFYGVAFGNPDDIPVPADYDGDGKADVAVFRPSNGSWYLLRSQLGFTGTSFGQNGDRPVPADYDGDGKTDIAVNRNGTWYIQQSLLGFTGITFGDGADKCVPADYDGDGKADIAVFRPSNGVWYIQRSQLGFTGIAFGFGTDLPVPADYDGDGKADISVFRNGTWYLQKSSAGFSGVAFGASTDLAVPNAFVR